MHRRDFEWNKNALVVLVASFLQSPFNISRDSIASSRNSSESSNLYSLRSLHKEWLNFAARCSLQEVSRACLPVCLCRLQGEVTKISSPFTRSHFYLDCHKEVEAHRLFAVPRDLLLAAVKVTRSSRVLICRTMEKKK